MKKQLFRMGLMALLLVTLLSACSGATTLEGEAAEQISAAADPIADAVLGGLQNGDYAQFSQYFDKTMAESMTESAFNDMRAQFSEKLGEYQGRTLDSVQEVNDYNSVAYILAFSNAPKVNMRLVLSKTDPPQMSGIWFDSPELRK